jgi:diadenosine tetraphosphate (Ap4A) HIT family hydrolase
MQDWKLDRIASAARGENPTVLAKMRSGFVVMNDTQFLPGYCILLGYPRVNGLNDLNLKARADFLVDMSLIGDAISAVCQPLRINYDILGNTDPFLHAHIVPRYMWEEETMRKGPVWLYPKEKWSLETHQFSIEKHGELKRSLSQALQKLAAQAADP